MVKVLHFKVLSIIVAIKAIPNSISTEELFKLINMIITEFLQSSLNIVPYAYNSTKMEQKLQQLVFSHLPSHITFIIAYSA